jgi:hypothetical protein
MVFVEVFIMRIVLLTMAMTLVTAQARAQLIHFTTIDGTNSGGASIPVPPVVRFSMGHLDIVHRIWQVFPDITAADSGQTLIATRESIGTFAWQQLNRLMSQGVSEMEQTEFVLIDVNGRGSGLANSCLFATGGTCNDLSVQPSWTPPNGIDLAGYHIDEFRLTVNSINFSSGGPPFTYFFDWTLELHGSAGQVPEPSMAQFALFTVLPFMFRYHTPA